LHIGGARTALFNYLLAKGAQDEGRFILRIDDTDKERSRPEYEAGIIEDLHWLGLDWDEGPDKAAIPAGAELPVSYRQSERTPFYDAVLRELRERGDVYPCFCSEERLEALRGEQLSRGTPPRYDGLCRSIPAEEAKRRMNSGATPCWRFALPRGKTLSFRDQVKGEMSFAPDVIGDFVAVRSDGQPTYLFASVVDDHLMEITHIVRGDEHLPNTARQQAIFDALGWPAPVYAHIPMILSEDRQKLSKRTGSTPIKTYREKGYFPEAMSAYLSTLSWTPPDDKVNLLSLSETAPFFSLSRVSVSSPIHDESHLIHWQKEAMKKKGNSGLLRLLTKADGRFSAFDTGAMALLIADLLEENPTLPLLTEALKFLLVRPSGVWNLPWLGDLAEVLRTAEPWTEDSLNSALRSFMKERGLKGKEFFHPLRSIFTGQDSGAALTLIIWVMGREETVARMEAAIR
jgi:glutamyl-tRNA synthetase